MSYESAFDALEEAQKSGFHVNGMSDYIKSVARVYDILGDIQV